LRTVATSSIAAVKARTGAPCQGTASEPPSCLKASLGRKQLVAETRSRGSSDRRWRRFFCAPDYDCRLAGSHEKPDFAVTRLRSGPMPTDKAPAYPADDALLVCVSLTPTAIGQRHTGANLYGFILMEAGEFAPYSLRSFRSGTIDFSAAGGTVRSRRRPCVGCKCNAGGAWRNHRGIFELEHRL
jgi:hypothetical protein